MDVRRNDELTVDEVEALQPDGIVISPGPCTPKEAGISIDLIRRMAGKVPILGVCLGHQAIGQAFGGKVVRAPKLMHGKTSHRPRRQDHLRRHRPPMTAPATTRSSSSRKACPPTSRSPRRTAERRTIMGLRHREVPIEGVQFHPESVLTDDGKRLIQNFLEL